MKLNGHIIITLPDFARHFQVNEFWANRYAFIRDMNPNKVYYWNDQLTDAYNKVCEWIVAESGKNATEEVRKEALFALQLLANTKIDPSDFSSCYKRQEVEKMSDIIIVKAPEALALNKYDGSVTDPSAPIKLHKIVITGLPGQKSDVLIGNKTVGTFESGEVVYVTERNGQFIELLPNHISNDFFDAKLIDNRGEFRSILIVKDKRNNEIVKIREVVSFALVNNGYMYIDFQDTIVCNNTNIPLFMLCDEEHKVLALSYNDGAGYALYDNGTLRTTNSFNLKKTVYINSKK